MQFLPTDEQTAFAEAIDEIVTASGGADIVQAWAAGDKAAGLSLWEQFSELGLGGLRVAEENGGLGASAVDLAIVFERLGYHGVPGPYIESLAFLPAVVSDEVRAEICGGAMATATYAPFVPYALDADVASLRFAVDGSGVTPADAGDAISSMAKTRTLFPLSGSGTTTAVSAEALDRGFAEAALATAAMLVGAGERLLDEAVEYAKIREQFGKPVGEYQALKHHLANVRVALSFARPLVLRAALDIAGPNRDRDVSAAKVSAADAATLAAKLSLQVHGAIGYTAEHHVGRWVTLVPALVQAWGSTSFHRDRVAAAILNQGA